MYVINNLLETDPPRSRFSLLSVLFQAQSGFNSLKPNRLKPDRVWKIAESNERSFYYAIIAKPPFTVIFKISCFFLRPRPWQFGI